MADSYERSTSEKQCAESRYGAHFNSQTRMSFISLEKENEERDKFVTFKDKWRKFFTLVNGCSTRETPHRCVYLVRQGQGRNPK
jgi:hypothetical protein